MRSTVGMTAHSSTGVPAGSLKCSVRPLVRHVGEGVTNTDLVEVARRLVEVLIHEHATEKRDTTTRSAIGMPLVRFSVRLWWQRSSMPRSQMVSAVSSVTISPITSV